MRLGVARLCLDCEEVHDADRCPVCGSETFAFLKRWVTPVAPPLKAPPGAGQDVPTTERVEQMDAYEQILKPEGQRSRKQRVIAHGALGLAALGAARLAWRVGKALVSGSGRTAPAAGRPSTLVHRVPSSPRTSADPP
jgi:hypothetical protein